MAIQPSSAPVADGADLLALVELALEEARVLGASQAEAAVSMDVGLSVSVRLGEVETVEYQRDRGMGVTVYFGTRKGSASTADLSAGALRESQLAVYGGQRSVIEAGLRERLNRPRDRAQPLIDQFKRACRRCIEQRSLQVAHHGFDRSDKPVDETFAARVCETIRQILDGVLQLGYGLARRQPGDPAGDVGDLIAKRLDFDGAGPARRHGLMDFGEHAGELCKLALHRGLVRVTRPPCGLRRARRGLRRPAGLGDVVIGVSGASGRRGAAAQGRVA
jgi:hypothetical protein